MCSSKRKSRGNQDLAEGGCDKCSDLHVTINAGHDLCVEALVQNGADVNAMGLYRCRRNGYTPVQVWNQKETVLMVAAR